MERDAWEEKWASGERRPYCQWFRCQRCISFMRSGDQGEGSLIWSFLRPPTSGCIRHLWHIPQDLRRRLERPNQHWSQGRGSWGGTASCRDACGPQVCDAGVGCCSKVIHRGHGHWVKVTGNQTGHRIFSFSLLFSLWGRAEKEGQVRNKWSDMPFP